MFISRSRPGEDPWVSVKVWAFTVGAALALAGIYFESEWLIWAAIAALLVGFAVRFLPGPDEGEEDGAREV